MEKNSYYPRYVDAEIETALSVFGAVCVNGPKFCGKTETSMKHAKSVFALDDSEGDYRNYRTASIDTKLALEGKEPHLIDEWQLVPPLWDAVRRSVDSDNRAGRFILCGSSTPEDNDSKQKSEKRPPLHSGFGRIANIEMRTMSLLESKDSEGKVSIKDLFDGNSRNTNTKAQTLNGLIQLVMQGGWPGNLHLNPEKKLVAVSRYPEMICEYDLQRVDRTKSPTTMKRVLKSLARNESTLASVSRIAKDIKESEDDAIKDVTVSSYIDTLKKMHLIADQPAFSPNIRSSIRVGKTPKRHLTDPALAAAIMGLTPKMLMDDLNTMGFLFEAMCERDLQIYAKANGGRLYHYRDSTGREIDSVVELPDGRWGAFEVKLGTGQIDEAAENLLRIKEAILRGEGKAPSVMCVISGMESAAYQREDGVYVVPVTSLRA